MNLTIFIKNFKKIKDLEQSFQSGNIYVIQGSNDIGKSTFLQAIRILATGENKNSNNVSFGANDGHIKGEFELDGADNNRYVVKYDFSKEKNTFTLIDPTTKVHKSTSRNNVIADIFKYNSFTVEEWFGWGLTSEGRKKQAEILLNLLPDDAKKEYLDIETKVNTKNGILYKERTEINSKYEYSKNNIEVLNAEETKLIKEKGNYEKVLLELKTNLESASNSERTILEYDLKSKEVDKTNQLFLINELETEIARLTKQLTETKEKYLNTLEEIDKINTKLKDIPVVNINIEETKQRIQKGEELLKQVAVAESKKKRIDDMTFKTQQLYHETTAKTKEIEDLRKRKQQILEDNELPVKEISIIDGEAMYVTSDGEVPFTKDNVSYSSGGMVIAKLMSHINKCLPIWLIGSAESYDKSRLNELQEIVKSNNGIIFLDKVEQEENTPLTIKCIE